MPSSDQSNSPSRSFAENGYSWGMTILTSHLDPVRAASGTWQQQMKWAVRDAVTLKTALQLPENTSISQKAADQFPVFVPLPFLQRIAPGDPDDPLLRQVLPVCDEENSPAEFSDDPLQEAESTLVPGLLKKYQSRALLVTTGACAVHCRYCFRRNFPYGDSPTSAKQWLPAIKKIAADRAIDEVILSGGDPLTLVDESIAELVDQVGSIEHVKRLRFHTRLPIMIPQRITVRLIDLISNFSGQVVVVIHANHANEFDSQVDLAMAKLQSAGALLLNQSVLLRGINDSAEALTSLSQRLLDANVLPYYLHQLDRVTGVAHFEVPRERGIKLIAQMRAALPGYAVPRYVKEEPGQPNKTVWA
jgi:EF-P beta-lysylation protein EpmB